MSPTPATPGPMLVKSEGHDSISDRLDIEELLKKYGDLPVSNFTSWTTVTLVKAALQQLEDNGSFLSAAQLFDAMGRDTRVAGTLDTRIRGLLGAPLVVEGGSASQKRSPVALELEAKFGAMFPDHELYQLVRWGLGVGLGVGELVWSTSPDEWRPTLRHWHPQHVDWDWNTRSFWITHTEGRTEIKPGDGKWVLFAPFGLYRGWMQGLVRSLAVPWLVRQWALRDWGRQSEVNGIPTTVVKMPADANKEEKTRLYTGIRNRGAESVMFLPGRPQGSAQFDVDLLEATARTWEGFKDLIAQADTDIAIAVLGQNLTTEVKGGSFAASATHDNVRQEVKDADDKALACTITDQCVKPWVSVNFGDKVEVPKVSRQVAPPVDLKADADRFKAVGEGIKALQAAGAQVDVKAVCEGQSIPLLKEAADASKGELYQYHFQFGIITINEARARLGLPPIPSGDVPPAPPAPAGGDGGGVKGNGAKPEGTPPSPDTNFPPGSENVDKLADKGADGVAYADSLTDKAKELAQRIADKDLLVLLRVIEQSQSFDELKRRVTALYGGMQPEQLAALMEKTLIMAELGGYHSVLEEL